MTTYKYRARTADGSLVNGVVEAASEFDAVDIIKRTCPIVEKVTAVRSSEKTHIDLNEPLWVSDKILSLTASQFQILLQAGIQMGRVVELIANQTTDRLMKRILTACAEDVNAGYSLAASLDRHGKKIPAAFIETVRAGEESGTLEVCFARLKTYYDKAHKVKTKVRSALTYPIFLIILAAIVVAIIMIRLVPTMLELFDNMGSELPLPTRILMAISAFFVNFWPHCLVVVTVIIIAYKLYSKTPSGELKLGDLKTKIPIIGRINIMNAASQFANTLSTLLSAGLPVARVLTITSNVMDNRAIGSSLEKLVIDLESGKSLGQVLKSNQYLPDMLKEMAAVGEESGSLEETMDTIGSYYDQEAVAASDKALAMLEPALTVIMGGMVAFILIAIYIPMFSMYNGAAV